MDFHSFNRWTTKNALLSDWVDYGWTRNYSNYSIRIEPDGWYYTSEEGQTRQVATSVVDTNQKIDDDLVGVCIYQLYVNRSSVSNQIVKEPYYATLLDAKGNVLDRQPQLNRDLDRSNIGFRFGEGVTGVSSISFNYADGSQAYVEGNMVIAY